MYYVNKLVGWCLSPLGMLFLGLGVSYLLMRLKWRRLAGVCAGLVLVLTWILGCGLTTRLIGMPLEGEEIEESALPSADLIVCLGGGMGVHEGCRRAEMFASADRVWMAARLYKAGKAPLIYVTGEDNEFSTRPLLQDFGVPANALRFADRARNTEEEAREVFQMLGADEGARRVLLVTSAWHMPRAKMLFEHAGLEVIAAPTDYEMHYAAEEDFSLGELLPGAEALWRNAAVIKEWIARFCYHMKYLVLG